MDAADLTFDVLPPEELVPAAAREIARLLRARLEAAPQASLALSGGRATVALCAALAQQTLPWERVVVFQVDERAVPPSHEDSNYRLIAENLLAPLGARAPHCERMIGEAEDLEAAARDYAAKLPAQLDVVVLGLGPDGHTASLFPGHPLLQEARAAVAPIFDSPKPPPRRLTLTLPVLRGAAHVVGLADGAHKQEAVRQLRAGVDLPAGRVRPAHWFLDSAAAVG
jgi:6-phosphogluconolactonase